MCNYSIYESFYVNEGIRSGFQGIPVRNPFSVLVQVMDTCGVYSAVDRTPRGGVVNRGERYGTTHSGASFEFGKTSVTTAQGGQSVTSPPLQNSNVSNQAVVTR